MMVHHHCYLLLLLLLLLQGIGRFAELKKTTMIAATTSPDNGEELEGSPAMWQQYEFILLLLPIRTAFPWR